jgi:hypothetical protein
VKGTSPSKVIRGSGNDEERYGQRKEQNTQHNGGPKQSALNAATGSEYASRVGTCQPAQARTLALQDHTQDEQNRDYNQRDIDISDHLQRVSFYTVPPNFAWNPIEFFLDEPGGKRKHYTRVEEETST